MTATSLPTVSVITPSFNQGAFLDETLRSVLGQDYPHVEYIVIDGASTDESVDVIRRYAGRLAYWVSEPDRGQAHAVNKGLVRATGEIIGWVNSDDLLTPGAIGRAVSAFGANQSVDVVYSDFDLLDERRGVRRVRSRPVTLVSLLRDGNVIPQPAAFVRRRLLDEIGFLDESLYIALDWDLWLRAALHGQLLHLPGESLAVLRDHGASKTRTQGVAKGNDLLRVLDKTYARADLPAPAHAVKRDAYARAYWWLAQGEVDRGHAYPEAAAWLTRALTLSIRPALAQPLATLRIALSSARARLASGSNPPR
jgi:glycosyltransferase involved in cell wall biosynthesis